MTLSVGEEIAMVRRNYVIGLRLDEVDWQRAVLLQRKLPQPFHVTALRLEDVLEVEPAAELRVLVTASNSYTHGTQTFIKTYMAADIDCGPFSKEDGAEGLRLIPKPERCAEQASIFESSKQSWGDAALSRDPPAPESRGGGGCAQGRLRRSRKRAIAVVALLIVSEAVRRAVRSARSARSAKP
ncbi:MAG: hypothetical protein ACLP8S_06590 [Solirubrobacteraceae bacterium]